MQFISLKASSKKLDKAERSLRLTLAFLHAMMDSNSMPSRSVLDLYETLHEIVLKDLNSSQGWKWMIMILESFHMNDCCIPYHQGETYELIFVSASKFKGSESFPQENFMKSLEHVCQRYYYDIGNGLSFVF